MSNFRTVEEAKAFLTEQGFYTGNLWSVKDVQSNYVCTEEEAQGVLEGALNNEATMEQIWFAINYHAENDGLKKTFQIGDNVEVPDPDDSDIHNHSFVGIIIAFKDEYAVVEDGDGDCFDIEIERLTLA